MRKLLAGTGALVVLAGVLIGIPLLLVTVAGNPFPTTAQWHAILTLTPDYGNIILTTKVIPLACWAAWAAFAGPFLLELFAAGHGHHTRKRLTVFRGQQRLAAVLIGAVLVMFAGTGTALAAAPAQAATIPAPVTRAAVAPAAASVPVEEPAPAAVKTQLVHTVVAGDTLWGLAQQYYGDGDRYPEIFNANRGAQPGGRTMTDPGLIVPGWHLTIPGVYAPATPAAPVPARRAPSSTVTTPAAGSPGEQAGNRDAGHLDTAGQGAVNEQHARQGQEESPTTVHAPKATQTVGDDAGFSIPMSTAGGIAGLLAAGILAALGARRLRQRRKRAVGQRIAMPDGQEADLELEMRLVETPVTVIDVDNALRSLQEWAEDTGQRLPELLAVRVADDEVALYLAAPADLPAPFESQADDGTAWVVRAGQAATPTRPTVSPYPALATIGTDEAGGYLLLDLEQIGSLNVAGDEHTAHGMLNALACEFATNPWSEQIQVTLVGIDPAIARDLNNARIDHVEDVPALIRNLRADLEDRRAALATYGVDGVLEARTRATDIESWAPHMVILGQLPDDELCHELSELVTQMPRLGIATISSSATISSGATILADSPEHAEYRSGGALPPLPFRPQILAGPELDLVHRLLDTTLLDAHPADLPAEHPRPDAPPLTGEPTTPEADDAADTATETADSETEPEAQTQDAPSLAGDLTAGAPSNRDSDHDQGIEPDAALTVPTPAPSDDRGGPVTADPTPPTDAAQETGETRIPDWPAPYVRVLGPVDILNAADAAALPGRGVEFLAFLLLNGGTVPGATVQQKLWPNSYDPKNGNARTLAKQVRKALGHDPDGNPLLPEGRSSSGFGVHPRMRTDWQDFCDLIGSDLKTTSNENLVRAIRLVRGTPFALPNRRRGWWTWRDRLEDTMMAAILDAADELAHRALQSGTPDQARMAARAAQAADPLNEAGWRLELETAMKTGDVDAFNHIVDEMYERIGDDETLDDATQQLIDTAQVALPGVAAR